MKKSIGSTLALYPVPIAVIGAMNGNEPTWTLVGHMGILGHTQVLVSLMGNHFINQKIKETKKLSINLLNEELLPKADYVGSHSGNKVNKGDVFEYSLSENSTPIIKDAPLTMICEIADIYNTKNFENFICNIVDTFVDEKYLNDKGKIDYKKFKPVLFEMPTYEFLKTGEVIGPCLSFK